MSNPDNSARVAQPQAVVGPITLGQKQGGKTITIEPNSSVDLNALSEALGTTTIALHSVSSTASCLTISVDANGSANSIVVTGQSIDLPATTFAGGTLLLAITRREDDIVLLTGGTAESHVTFPIGSGTVTATFITSLAI
jgi:hypothetical protein